MCRGVGSPPGVKPVPAASFRPAGPLLGFSPSSKEHLCRTSRTNAPSSPAAAAASAWAWSSRWWRAGPRSWWWRAMRSGWPRSSSGSAWPAPSGTLHEFRPTVLVLNAGVKPSMGPLHEQSWEGFSSPWNSDVKAGFHWIQEAIRLPLPRGSRVLIASSGAAIAGSPMSGGYAGAKRMLWIMATQANGGAASLGLGILFQARVPQQMTAAGGVGRTGADFYSRRKGISAEQFLAGFGKPLSA